MRSVQKNFFYFGHFSILPIAFLFQIPILPLDLIRDDRTNGNSDASDSGDGGGIGNYGMRAMG